MNELLKAKLKTLPAAPGVYFHRNSQGEIIYVGKAAVLKNRVRSYFNNSPKDPKTTALVEGINDTEWIVVDTEMDALFLESEMIKRYMPKWNILLRDDKTVSYVRITTNEKIPDVSTTRNPLDDGAKYIGPFYGKNAIERSLRILRKIFPFYTKPYNGQKNLDTDLNLSPGIEVGKMTEKEYRLILYKLISYLEGKRSKLLKEIEKSMYEASASNNYELAAKYRNELLGLKGLQNKIIFSDKEFLDISSDRALRQLQNLLHLDQPPRRIEGYDISHQSGTNVAGSMVVFINGVAARDQYRKFKLHEQRNDDPASLKEVLERRLKYLDSWGRPDLVILDGGELQIKAVANLLKKEKIPFLAHEKSGNHTNIIKTHQVFYSDGDTYKSIIAHDEDFVKLMTRIDDEAHRFAITYHNHLKRKTMFE